MTYSQERKIRREYERKFDKVPFNVELDVVALTRLLKQALRTGVEVDWYHVPQHPYDDWIGADGQPV